MDAVSSKDIESKVRNAPGAAVLDFYQASCAPCRSLEPVLKQVALQYAAKVQVYRVGIDRDLELAKVFHVTSLPTVLVVKNGQELMRLDGLIREHDLKAAFQKAGA